MSTRGRKMHSKTVWPSSRSAPLPRYVKKIGRNEPCPCGSGKKYKDCHAHEGEVFLHKLAHEEEKKRLKAIRAQMKEAGVPWFKRIFFVK